MIRGLIFDKDDTLIDLGTYWYLPTIKTIEDEQDTEINYYFGQELTQSKVSLGEYKNKIDSVGKEDIIAIANKVRVNTVYFLKD